MLLKARGEEAANTGLGIQGNPQSTCEHEYDSLGIWMQDGNYSYCTYGGWGEKQPKGLELGP